MRLGTRAGTALLIACWLLGSAGVSVASEPVSPYEALYEDLVRSLPKKLEAAQVEDFVFRRDTGAFVLESGTIYLHPGISGRSCIAIFHGRGRLLLNPPIQIERDQLDRIFGSENLDWEFENLVLFAGDHSLLQLQARFDFTETDLPPLARSAHERFLKYTVSEDSKTVWSTFARLILNETHTDYTFGYVDDRFASLAFEYSPFAGEEIRLLYRDYHPRDHYWFRTISQFHKASDYETMEHRDSSYDAPVLIRHYDIRMTIPKSRETVSECTATIEALSNERWFDLTLAHSLDVTHVSLDGSPARYYRHEDGSSLWVEADPPLEPGEQRVLQLSYEGKPLRRDTDWIYLPQSTSWYPRTPTRALSTFDLNFEVSEDLTFVSAGTLVETTPGEETVSYRYEITRPSRNASFGIGFFDVHTLENEGAPPVTVYVAENAHARIGRELGYLGVGSGKDMEVKVASDLSKAAQFFQKAFGPCDAKSLAAVDIPSFHGEAFPGLVHLTWATFQNNDIGGLSEAFRAHEVAHQWWGHGVDFESYHDVWLVEGFAEFCALWAVDRAHGSEATMYEILRDNASQIINKRTSIFGEGRRPGPIWLGHRTENDATEGDYHLIIYKKGAWVLHMLRIMMRDLRTGNEDAFTLMMREFYERYSGGMASTWDFIETVESHMGKDMGWFFDQWVFGASVPSFKYAYDLQEEDDGSYRAIMKVEQEGVPETFESYVVIHIEFEDGTFAPLRLHVSGAESEFELPPLPQKPKTIVFNAMESVLCEHEQVRWKD